MTRFCRFALRTTDADAASAFYATVFGHDRAEVWPLHERALARGARPHWLGQIGVEDVERTATAFVERGGARLGPTQQTGDGERAVLRDPGGAVVALATPLRGGEDAIGDVVWHVLHTNDAARAITNYRELFGWAPAESIDLGALGVFQRFAWHAGGESVGAIGDVAQMRGVHPHWLFFFEVDALEPAMAATRTAGGVARGPLTLPGGERVCVCDDPQGAAFALRERV
jgi:uncharacterized protein